eukprot:CAMPEP_0201879518 /NCGR_PEP_ID=MMETSP0902-20130614/10379_1 /ASSEMBLY_ACC=CAM_ASM_000551 /TAXON_ID=420261 /ORGANISM="Thalassiosira antarctica, Strain CCMP982" /LENGTH=63 /DNA_ID=CAMNT_0048407359 /DNA_START=70 /DNA_END=258 /DNA_ORIENTATION=-
MDRRSNISEAIEMASMDAALDNDENNEKNANNIFEPTHQTSSHDAPTPNSQEQNRVQSTCEKE